jgi:hypothetical protein
MPFAVVLIQSKILTITLAIRILLRTVLAFINDHNPQKAICRVEADALIFSLRQNINTETTSGVLFNVNISLINKKHTFSPIEN